MSAPAHKRAYKRWLRENKGRYEVRLNPPAAMDAGEVDEIVAWPDFVHLEQMNTNSWWLGITMPGGDLLSISIYSDRRVKIRAVVTEEPKRRRKK